MACAQTYAQEFSARLNKALTQPMQLDDWSRNLERFMVRTANGSYWVTVGYDKFSCTCPDFFHRHRSCKHVLFVQTRVLKAAADDPLLRQKTMTPFQIERMLANAPAHLRRREEGSADLLCPSRLSTTVNTSWQDRMESGKSSLSRILTTRPANSFVVSVESQLEDGSFTRKFTFFDSASCFFKDTAQYPHKFFSEVVELNVWTKLYFDVEHYVQSADVPSKITDCLFVIKQALVRQYPQIEQKMHVIDDVILLTSSRPVDGGMFKHSYHVIFPLIQFQGTAKMKDFAKGLCGDQRLQAYNRKGAETSMIDTRVYNKNQSFRLIESRKFGTEVPLQYADKRRPLSLQDLLRTVLTHDEGDDGIRISQDSESVTPPPAPSKIGPWPAGATRYFDDGESTAFTMMQFNFGEDGNERLQAVRQHFRDQGYLHFLLVEWRKKDKRYLYAFKESMEEKAKEIHTVLRELCGEQLKNYSLGSKINNYGDASWVKAGFLVSDGELGYLSEEEIDSIVSNYGNPSETAVYDDETMYISREPSPRGKERVEESKSPSPRGKERVDESKSPSPRGKERMDASRSPSPRGKERMDASRSPSLRGKECVDESRSSSPILKSRWDNTPEAAKLWDQWHVTKKAVELFSTPQKAVVATEKDDDTHMTPNPRKRKLEMFETFFGLAEEPDAGPSNSSTKDGGPRKGVTKEDVAVACSALKAKSDRGTDTKTKKRVRLEDDNVIREPSGQRKCQHGKRKTRCHQCGGGSICEHNRERNRCHQCGGGSICAHKRERNRCKECGGSSICEHNRERSGCRECGGAKICQHNRERAYCRECGGSSICEHNRQRKKCKECLGTAICEHNRQKNLCKECGGSSICEHKRKRNCCRECGGISICEHNRERNLCKDCAGASICEHKRRRVRCQQCPRCAICRVSTASREGIYGMMCFQCSQTEQTIRLTTTRNIADILKLLQQKGSIKASRQIQLQEVRKKKEEAVKSLLQDHIAGSSTQIVHDQGVLQADSVCDGSRKRPDFQILHDHQEHLDIWVEVDEFQHLKNGAYVCELGRINEMVFWARTIQRPCVVIRINLDAFTAPSKPSTTPLLKKERYPLILQAVSEQIAQAKSAMPTFALKIIHLFFDCPSACDGKCGYRHEKIYYDSVQIAKEIAGAK